MLSRVADSLYWMSRYLERTDGILRMLKMNYASSQDDRNSFTWRPVLKIFSALKEEELERFRNDSRQVLVYMLMDKENANSVLNMVTRSRENARAVQDHITKEVWQCLNELYHLAKDEKLAHLLLREDPITILDGLIRQGQLYYGTTEVTMARGEGFCFINIGKYVERAIQSADILDVKFSDLSYDQDQTPDTTFWKYLLLSISGYELYLKSYRSGFEARNVVEQILFNNQFPRSVSYSVNQLHRYFERLKNERNQEGYERLMFMIGKLRSRVQYSKTDDVLDQGLHPYLKEIRQSLFDIGVALNQHYFAYS
jgi:uncharacterized alpha-E superfamily protein